MNEMNETPTGRPNLDSVVAAPTGLGDIAIAGATWLMLQQVVLQLLGLGSKVAVARLVSKEDIGWATLALSICSFLSFIQPSSLNDVLVQRQRHFRRWANSAFWIASTAAGLMLAGGIIAAIIAGVSFQNHMVFVMVGLGTLSLVFTSVTVVWGADLAIRFQFRSMVKINTLSAILVVVFTVAMAFLHMGALTLVFPATLAACVTFFLYLRTSGFRPHGRPHVRRWKYLVGDNLKLMAVSFFANVTMQADNFCIGVYHSKSELAIYALGYSLSFQFAQLAGRSLRGVMLPAFSNLSSDPERRERAYLQTTRMVGLLCMPACILMVPAAPAVVRIIFSSAWDSSAVLIQYFLMTMGFAVIGGVAVLTLQARGFLGLCVLITAINAVLFIVVVWPVAAFSDINHVALCVCVIYALFGTLHPVLASIPSTWGMKFRVFLAIMAPFILASGSAAAGWACARRAGFEVTDIRYALISGLVGTAIYCGLAWLILRETVSMATARLFRMTGRWRRH